MDAGDLFQLIIQLLLLLFVLYLAFFKSYFSEKGKNLATQEDVQRITSLVENVKVQLQFSLQAKLVLKREEHDALLQYYSKLYAWVEAVSGFEFAGITYETLDELDKRMSNIDIMHSDTSMALAKVEVLIDNEEFKTQGRELMVKILEFQRPTQEMCGKFKLSCLEVHNVRIEAKKSGKLDTYRDALDGQRDIVREYRAEQFERYSALYPHIVKHRQLLSALLKSIVSNG